jgi:hypothetical protein
MRKILVFLSVAGLCAIAEAAVDPVYKAGEAYGATFYWLPLETVRPDTLQWRCFCKRMQEHECPSENGFAPAAEALAVEEWRMVRVKKCSAMALAILVEQKYPVCVLSQWHGTLRNKVVIARPGMSTKELRHTVLSDFRWEHVEQAEVRPAPGGGGYKVEIWFENAGKSEYSAEQMVVSTGRQIQGSDGLKVHLPEFDFFENIVLGRTVYDIVLLVRAGTDLGRAVKDIEKAMDGRKLDLSYRAPAFTLIEPPARAAVPPQPLPEPVVVPAEAETSAADSAAAAGTADSTAAP